MNRAAMRERILAILLFLLLLINCLIGRELFYIKRTLDSEKWDRGG